jgi:CTP synthase (UTP-ammonia lyase)
MKPKRVGLIGDCNPDVMAHRLIPKSLALAAQITGVEVEPVWLPTNEIKVNDAQPFAGFAGLWCVPASPYANMEGALWAIRFAREQGVPFLGTCGGFQHALIEFARNVVGIRDADHAETSPDAAIQVISLLSCSLVEQTGTIRLRENSLIHSACGGEKIVEAYHCRYGLNPEFRNRLEGGALQFTGWDENGDPRVLELRDHPFFVATLFQPERAALRGASHLLIRAFVRALERGG